MAAGLVLEFHGVGKSLYDTVNAKLGIDMETGTGDWPPGRLQVRSISWTWPPAGHWAT